MDNANGCVYEFGPFRVDVLAGKLFQGGQPITITPKTLSLLIILIESDGQLLEKDELMKMLWGDTFVEEHNLTQNVSVLRKVLGEKSGEHRYIVTVPGRGYRFTVPVKKIQLSETSFDAEIFETSTTRSLLPENHRQEKHRLSSLLHKYSLHGLIYSFLIIFAALLISIWLWAKSPKAATPQATKSIAILPFKSLDKESCVHELAIPMADALITKLGQVNQISVRSTSDIIKYECSEKDAVTVGREMGVDLVLEGKVQKIGDEIRITVQVLNMQDGTLTWAEKFDSGFGNRFQFQDAVTEQIIQSLAPSLFSEVQAKKLN
jgi:DNA-binding winged helix-turn-helix (wHTH) protein/TolB-like protein